MDDLGTPKNNDAVMGGQNHPCVGSLVLGGLAGVEHRLSSPTPKVYSSALFEALRYGDEGIELVQQALKDEKLRWRAFSILYAHHSQTQDLLTLLEERLHDESEAKRVSALADSSGIKTYLAQRLKTELEFYSSAMVGIDFPIPGAGIADVAAVFPTGYVLAFVIQLAPITLSELTNKSTKFLESGADIIWWFDQEFNNRVNKEWCINNYGIAYSIKFTPTENPPFKLFSLNKDLKASTESWIEAIQLSIQYPEQYYVNLFNDTSPLQALARYNQLLETGTEADLEGASILFRAILQTFHTWRRISNAQLKRGLLLQNRGRRSFGGFLGGLSNHYYHTKVTAIEKQSDGYWMVKNDEKLSNWYLSPQVLFPESGRKRMKNLATLIATLMPQSQQS